MDDSAARDIHAFSAPSPTSVRSSSILPMRSSRTGSIRKPEPPGKVKLRYFLLNLFLA